MVISGIQSGQEVYRTLFTRENSMPPSEPSTVEGKASDTVQISEEARELARKDQAEKEQEKTAAVQDRELPLEAYSIPGWMGDLMPGHVKLDSQLGQSYSDSNAALRDSLSPSDKNDLDEYMDTLYTIYEEESESRGIETAEDYYNAIVLNKDPALGEELQQAVQQRLAENPRMTGLMTQFGVTL